MNRYQYALTSGLMLIASTSALANYDVAPYVELLLMAGVTTTDSENVTLETFSFQELEQTNQSDWNFFTGQVGVGYVYPLADISTGAIDWFPSIMPQINVYFIDGGEIIGNVYEQPTYVNNLDYTMDYNNIRAMFDLGVSVLAIDRFSIYALAGVGMSWNSIDLKANPTLEGMDNDVDGFELYGQHSSSMAYEFGAGASFALLDSVSISVEYLYAGILDVKIDQNNNDYTDVASTEFDINTQTILAGLRLKFP